MAGVPKEVLNRAKQILKNLEENDETPRPKPAAQKEDLGISIESFASNEIIEELAALDVTTYTPIEALNKLYELSGKAKNM